MRTSKSKWHLVRTKQYKEAFVRNMLSKKASDTFLPLLRIQRPHWGKVTHTVTPLFPCYLFAQIDLETEYHFVQRTPGVVGLLCAGGEPSEVDESVIEEIRKRGTNGIVELPQGTFSSGESVSVVSGPLRGISAIFERYMSGSQRAALLLDLIGGASVRTILPCALIAPLNKPAPVAVASRRALT
jgi:transcription elongation factor/antiterminator RfaH